ncbi:hypothetical protein [Enterococcus sp. 1001283B150225_161107_E12]|uniref:hypothetical protein n=1 Tax=Enterococcus sp. 1001283B150225_161107_E12 TaxID=2787145 RepID=UPI001E3B516B|nr:hypothetical protein [Enterococcus sp. 1001283B150225_161107_E12]
MQDKEDKVLLILGETGTFLVVLVLKFAGIIYGGFVTMKLWNGIISPTFSFDQLNFFQGLGLDLFVSYLFYNSGISGKYKSESIFAPIIESTISTTLFWSVGSLIMFFI